jgi:DNA-binding transcriptional ArsR family regulator
MSDKRKQPHGLPPRLKEVLAVADLGPRRKRALEHLPRLELFIFLMERTDGSGTSEQELATAFAMSIRLVEYHLKVLQDADLVANVAEGKGSGAPEPSYVASAAL